MQVTGVWVYTLGSVIVVSLVSVVGLALIGMRPERLQRVVFMTVSLAVGAMFGGVFIHLLPRAFAANGGTAATSMLSIGGILMFFLLEKVLLWRHEHVPHYGECIHPVGYVSLVADGLHNFIDGVLIGTSYLVSLPVGLATTTAVVLHEVPQEIGDFGVLMYAGFSRSRALLLNLCSASCAIVGAVITLLLGSHLAGLPSMILPVAAGGFIYVAGSDLVPELQKERNISKSFLQLLGIGAGVALMLLLTVLE